MKEKDHIEEHKEWQDNQFSPGHFTGGKIPSWIKDPGNSRNLGITFIILGLFISIEVFSSIHKILNSNTGTYKIISTVFTAIFSITWIIGGIILIKRKK